MSQSSPWAVWAAQHFKPNPTPPNAPTVTLLLASAGCAGAGAVLLRRAGAVRRLRTALRIHVRELGLLRRQLVQEHELLEDAHRRLQRYEMDARVAARHHFQALQQAQGQVSAPILAATVTSAKPQSLPPALGPDASLHTPNAHVPANTRPQPSLPIYTTPAAPELYVPGPAAEAKSEAPEPTKREPKYTLMSPDGSPYTHRHGLKAPVAIFDAHGNKDKVSLFPVYTRIKQQVVQERPMIASPPQPIVISRDTASSQGHPDIPAIRVDSDEVKSSALEPKVANQRPTTALPPYPIVLSRETTNATSKAKPATVNAMSSEAQEPITLARPVAVVNTEANHASGTTLPFSKATPVLPRSPGAGSTDAAHEAVEVKNDSDPSTARPTPALPPKPIVLQHSVEEPVEDELTQGAQEVTSDPVAHMVTSESYEAPDVPAEGKTVLDPVLEDLTGERIHELPKDALAYEKSDEPIRPAAQAKPDNAFATAMAAQGLNGVGKTRAWAKPSPETDGKKSGPRETPQGVATSSSLWSAMEKACSAMADMRKTSRGRAEARDALKAEASKVWDVLRSHASQGAVSAKLWEAAKKEEAARAWEAAQRNRAKQVENDSDPVIGHSWPSFWDKVGPHHPRAHWHACTYFGPGRTAPRPPPPPPNATGKDAHVRRGAFSPNAITLAARMERARGMRLAAQRRRAWLVWRSTGKRPQ